MQNRNDTKILLQPTVSSAVCCMILAGIILIGANWDSLLQSLPFYDYLLGNDGLLANQDQSLSDIFFNSRIVNTVIIILAALFLGGLIYFALQSRQYIVQGRNIWQMQEMARLGGERRQRVRIRLVILAGWLLYTLVFFTFLVPFSVTAAEVGINHDSFAGIFYVIFGLALLCLALHAHVVMLRLSLLRLRVFGGSNVDVRY